MSLGMEAAPPHRCGSCDPTVLALEETLEVKGIVSGSLEGKIGRIFEDLLCLVVREGGGGLVERVQECLLLPCLKYHK